MIGEAPHLDQQALALRHAFDSTFARPPESAGADLVDFIALRLGDEGAAIPTAEIGGLYRDLVVTPVPGPFADFLGIAAFRGDLAPVYDLGLLLGLGPSAGRWIALDATGSIGLGFDEFDGHLRLPRTAMAARTAGEADARGQMIVTAGGRSWPLVAIPPLIETVRERVQRGSRKE